MQQILKTELQISNQINLSNCINKIYLRQIVLLLYYHQPSKPVKRVFEKTLIFKKVIVV